MNPSSKKPNFIIRYADDPGYGDGYGYGAERISTPNIDRLAAEGIRFDNGPRSKNLREN